MYKKSKRFLAGFLALLLTVTMLPTDMLSVVYAEEDNEAIVADVSEDNDVEEAEALENAVLEDDAEEALEEDNNLKDPDPSEPASDPVTDPSKPASDPVTDPSEPASDPVTDPSEPASDPVEADLAPPTANPASGTAVTSGTTITLTNPSANAAGSKIYYSVVTAANVTTPPAADAITQEYTAPFAITEASTVYAVVKGATKASAVAAFAYTIKTSGGPTTKDIVYTLNGDEVAAALGGEKYNAETGLMTEGVTIAGQKVNDYFTIGGKGSVNQISLYEAGTLAEQTTNVYIWDTSITENKTKNTVLIEGGGIAADNNWISFTTKTPNAKLVFYSAYKRSQDSDKELVVRKDSATSSTATWRTAATVARKTIITKYPTDKDYITLPTAGTYYIGYTGGGGIVPFIQVTETVEVSDTPDAPMADPADGSVLDEDDKVSLSVLDDEATIYYTTGATEDTTENPKTASNKKTYNPETKITIDVNNKVIKAYAEKSTGASEVITFTYKLRVAVPEAEPENHVLAANGGTITLKCATTDADIDADADKVKIYYTTDGTTPSVTPSALYTEPFSISKTSVIKAIATKTGWESSNVSEFTYIVPTTGETEYIANASIDNGIAAYFKLIGKPGAETVEVKKPSTSDYSDASSATFWADCKEVIADASGNTKVINLTGGSLSSVDNDVTNAVRFVTSAPKTKVVVYHSQKGIDAGGQIQLSSVTDDGKVKADVASDASDHSKIVKSEFTITEPGIYAIGFRGSNKGGGIIPYISVTENPSDGGGLDPLNKPTATPAAGAVEAGTTVELSAGTGEDIYYTTNGTNPAVSADKTSVNGTKYESAITVSEAVTIKAIAVKFSDAEPKTVIAVSSVETFAYTIKGVSGPTTYTVKFFDGTTELTALEQTEVSGTLNLSTIKPTTIPSGKTFKGWSTTKNGTTVVTSINVTGDTSLYAVWEDAEVESKVAKPVADPGDGKEFGPEGGTVKLSCATEGAKIYYTTDKTNPTKDSALYDDTKGIEVKTAMTIKAIAIVTEGENAGESAILEASYTILAADGVAKPTATPEPTDDYAEFGTKVTLKTATEGADIYYTVGTKGQTPSDPTVENGTKYEAPIEIQTTTTIKAVAVKVEGEGNAQTKKYSAVATFTYKIDEPISITPVEKEVLLKDCVITVPSIVEGSKVSVPPTYVTYKDPDTKQTVKFTEGIDYTVAPKQGATNTLVLTGAARDPEDGRSVDGYTIPTSSTLDVEYSVISKTNAKNKSQYIDVSKAKITLNKNETKGLYYTGYAQEPSLDFSKASEYKALYEAGRLNIAYRNNINAGKATVIISVIPEQKKEADDTQKQAAVKTNDTQKQAAIEADGTSDPMTIEGFDADAPSETSTEVNPPAADTSKEYYGAKTLTFTIKKAALNKNNAKATAETRIFIPKDLNYDGMAIEPEVSVASKPGTGKKAFYFEEGKDYTVTYKNSRKAGKATVTVKGVGNNLSGSSSATYTIEAVDLANWKFDMTDSELKEAFVYSPKGARLTSIWISKGDGDDKDWLQLYEGIDYTAKYKYATKDKKAGDDVTVSIKGKNGCKGALADQTLKIQKADFEDSIKLTAKKGLYREDGEGGISAFYVDKDSKKDVMTDLQKTVIVTDNSGAKLKLNKDYVITAVTPSAIDVDPAKPAKTQYIVQPSTEAKANYNEPTQERPDAYDKVDINYEVAKNFAKDKDFMFDKTLEKNDPLGYDGRNPVEITQDVLDKYVNKYDSTLENNTAVRKYELGKNIEIVEGSYKNNVKKGTAQVTIRGIGDTDQARDGQTVFYGSKVLKFKIVEK